MMIISFAEEAMDQLKVAGLSDEEFRLIAEAEPVRLKQMVRVIQALLPSKEVLDQPFGPAFKQLGVWQKTLAHLQEESICTYRDLMARIDWVNEIVEAPKMNPRLFRGMGRASVKKIRPHLQGLGLLVVT